MGGKNLCVYCGAEQREGARFCLKCGKPMAAGEPPVQAEKPPYQALPPVKPPPVVPQPAAPQAAAQRSGVHPPEPIDAPPEPVESDMAVGGSAGDKRLLLKRPIYWGGLALVLVLCVCVSALAVGGYLLRQQGGDLAFLEGLLPATKTPTITATPTATKPPTITATPTATPIPPSPTLPPPTATSESVKGVDEPMRVSGSQIQLVSAKRQDSYKTGGTSGQTIEAKSPADELMVAEFTVISSGSSDISKVKVVLVDEHGRESMANITVTKFDDGGVTSVTWIFVVSRAAEEFTLKFPDGQTISLP